MSEEMELVSSEEEQGEIKTPMPLNCFPFTNNNTIPYNNSNTTMYTMPYNIHSYPVTVRYKECLKNHAASMGGHAIDGCGEFIPTASNGSSSNSNSVVPEQLICSACKCHRNFHRKEIEAHDQFMLPYHPHHHSSASTTTIGHPTTRTAKPHQMMPHKFIRKCGSSLPSQGDEQLQEHNSGGRQMIVPSLPSQGDEQLRERNSGGLQVSRKRFRTKFSQEQKEKMSSFAEKVGWRIPKEDECVVQDFCEEIGVKRKVLKVWMHNNKYKLAKNLISINTTNDLTSA